MSTLPHRGFCAEAVTPHVTRIRDPFDVAMYLVAGKKRACLIDTGFGFGGLGDYVRGLTDLPLTVLLSHGHFDHAGGAAAFGDVRMSLLDCAVYERNAAPDYREAFLSQRFDWWRGAPLLPPCDAREFGVLADGDELDLGGVRVQAVHVPGHTAGSMMFFLPEERIMVFGDACGPGTLLLEPDSPAMGEYLAALERLHEFDGAYDRILRFHGNFESGLDVLGTVIEAARAVATGTDDAEELGPAYNARFVVDSGVRLLRAKRTREVDGAPMRADGLVGNISYRADKR